MKHDEKCESGTSAVGHVAGCLCAERRLAAAEEFIRSLRLSHHVSEDCWYSCPKALDEDGESACCNDNAGNECNCGADAFNAKIDAFLASFTPPTERTQAERDMRLVRETLKNCDASELMEKLKSPPRSCETCELEGDDEHVDCIRCDHPGGRGWRPKS